MSYDLKRRERIEWTNSWIEDARDSSNPRLLLIGDSCTRKLRKSIKRLLPIWNCDVLATSYSVDDPHFLAFVDSYLQDTDYQYRLILLQVNHHGSLKTSDAGGLEMFRQAYADLTERARRRAEHVVWLSASASHRVDRHNEIDDAANAELQRRNGLVRDLCLRGNILFVDFYQHAMRAGYAYEDEFHFRWRSSWRNSARFILGACVEHGAIEEADLNDARRMPVKFFEKSRRLGRCTIRIFGVPVFFYRRPMVTMRRTAGGTLSGKTVLRIDVGARNGRPRDGLCALVNHALGWMAYADSQGMVPIVDMLSHPTIYQAGRAGQDPWEFFFAQPGGIPLAEAAAAGHVATTIWRMDGDEMPGADMDFFNDSRGTLTRWRKLATRFLRPSPRILGLVSAFEEESNVDYEETVGVLVRGTDYLKLRPQGHPVQPDAKTVISDVRDLMAHGPYQRVFLVTEDQEVKSQFLAAFGAQLLLAPQKSVPYADGYLADSDAVANNVEMGVAYLVSVLLLSKCRAIVAGRTSGSVAAAYFSKGFAYQKFYDIGTYGRNG